MAKLTQIVDELSGDFLDGQVKAVFEPKNALKEWKQDSIAMNAGKVVGYCVLYGTIAMTAAYAISKYQ